MEIKRNVITITLACCCILVVDAGVGSVDFAKIKNHTFFVDKTMLIKEFLEEDPKGPKVKLITAPTKFGKSTIIDMLKRFLAIPVDKYGKRTSLNTTNNYRIFCDNKLKICENKTFVEQHMGQYPVIHINYHNFETIGCFSTFIKKLHLVVKNTFDEHDYLIYNSTNFPNQTYQNLYMKFCSSVNTQNLSRTHLKASFLWLANLLSSNFGKKVIVLVDNYEAHINELLFGNVHELASIAAFLNQLNKNLFESENNHVHTAIMMGVMRVKQFSFLPVNITTYQWLGDHAYSKYLGFTSEAVLKVVKEVVINERKNEIKQLLKIYYDGYQVQQRPIQLYNMWSVINFFLYKCTSEGYWCKASRLNEIERLIVNNSNITEVIKKLVIKRVSVKVDITETLDLYDYVRFKTVSKLVDPNRFMVLLFERGFLTPLKPAEKDKSETSVRLKIPNMEIRMEFCRLLSRYYVNIYNYSLDDIKHLHSAVESFDLDKSNKQAYKGFFRAVYYLITRSNYYPRTVEEFHASLFIMLTSAFPPARASVYKKTQIKFDYKKRKDIVICNAKKMAIVIQVNCLNKTNLELMGDPNDTKASLDIQAWESLGDIFVYFNPILDKRIEIHYDDVKVTALGRIYIGIGYDLDTRDISISFQHPLHDKEPILYGKP